MQKTDSKIRMQDIANKLDISISTVSRALSNKNVVKSKTLARIMELTSQLNYRPNLNARALASNKTHLIGFLLHTLRSDSLPNLIEQMQKLLAKQGYDLQISISFGNPDVENKIIDSIISRGFDGVIFHSPVFHGKHESIERLLQSRIPCITEGYYDYSPVSQVCGDYKQAGRAITRHLLELGHTKIAFVSTSMFDDPRLDGYRQAHSEFGVSVDENRIFCNTDISLISDIAKKILDMGTTALFASLDALAIKFLKEFKTLNVKIPEDIALAGFGNEKYTEIIEPSLTTYIIYYEHMATYLVNMLLECINSSAPKHTILLPGKLLPRKSTLG